MNKTDSARASLKLEAMLRRAVARATHGDIPEIAVINQTGLQEPMLFAAAELRSAGIATMTSYTANAKKQFTAAERAGCDYALILKPFNVTLRDMVLRENRPVNPATLVDDVMDTLLEDYVYGEAVSARYASRGIDA